MKASLPEVLKSKNKGDKWYSFLAPEELHRWEAKKPWDRDNFKRYDVQLLSISVIANETVKGTKNATRYTRKNPLYLENCGIYIEKAKIETKQKRYGLASFRCDGIVEMNRILKELSDISEIGFWWIKKIEIANNDAICQFDRHNPDGHGVNLYFYRLILGKETRLYPDVCFSDQEHYLGKFKQYFAACECDERILKFHGCTIEKKVRKPILS